MNTMALVAGFALALAIVLVIASTLAWRRRREVLLMQEVDILHRIELLEHENIRTRRDLEHTQTDLMHTQQQLRVSTALSSRRERTLDYDIFERLGRAQEELPVPVEVPPEAPPARRETLSFRTITAYERLLQDDED